MVWTLEINTDIGQVGVCLSMYLCVALIQFVIHVL